MKKNKFWLISMVLVLIACLLGAFLWDFKTLGEPDQTTKTTVGIPTLFIPGYEGNRYSFGRMISRFEADGVAEKAMVIEVKENDELVVEGKLQGKNPMIQVLFADNQMDELQQSLAILTVMEYLDSIGVEKVNFVAHSMGGVSVLRYLVEYYNRIVPETVSFVSIAAPFNDLEVSEDTEEIFAYELTEAGPEDEAPIYEYFDEKMQHLSPDLRVLNIAGDLEDGTDSDGSVSFHSSFALDFLLEEDVDYTPLLIKGEAAGHSALHENSQVDKAIKDFLWH